MLVFLKSKEELEGFAKAGAAAGRVLAKLLKAVKPGVPASCLDEIAREECEREGGTPTFLGYDGFPAAACVSVNEGVVHGVPEDIEFEEGDVVSVDVGVTIDGFIGDNADTVIAGDGSKDDALLIEMCRNALKAGIDASAPGNTLGDVGDAIARASGGYGLITDYGGHGINRNAMHADPFVANEAKPASGILLRPGMVFAIEPMIADCRGGDTTVGPDGWLVLAGGRSAHCEHTVCVTERGARILTTRPEEKE